MDQIGLDAVLNDENFQAGIKRYMSSLGQATEKTEKASSGMTAFGHTMSTAVGSAIGYLTGQAIPALINGLGGLVKGALAGNAEFERYSVQFTTLLGNADDAKKRLDELATFGAKTPFELPEVVRADKILQGFGLHSVEAAKQFGFSGAEIRTIAGDVASGTGASFEDMSMLLGKFSTGATGEALARMAELGIGSKTELAKMGLEFSKSGELLTPLPKAMNVVLTLMKTKYGGLMDAQSATFEGMVSNLQDWWGQTKRQIAAPIFDVVKENLGGLLTFLGSAQVKGAITGFAENLSKGLASAMESAKVLLPALQGIGQGLAGLLSGNDLFALGDASLALTDGLYGMAKAFGATDEQAEIFSQDVADVIDKAIRAFKEISTTMQKMATAVMPTFQKVAAKIGVELQKVAKDIIPLVMKQVTKFSAWFKENEPLITKTLKVIAEKFGDLAVGVIGAWRVIGPAIDGIITLVLDLVKIVMQAINGDWAGVWDTAKKIVSDAWNAIKTVSIAFGNWIASWMGTTLDGIARQWRDNWEMFGVILNAALNNLRNYVSTGFTAIVNTISSAWTSILNNVTTAWQAITQAIYNAIAAIPQAVSDAVAGLIEIGTSIVSTIEEGISSTWNLITDWISSALTGLAAAVWNSDIFQSVMTVGNNIIYAIRSGISTLWSAAEGVIGKMQELLGGFWDSVKDSMASVIATGAGIVEAIKQGIINNWNGFVDWLKGLIGGIFGGGGSGYGVNGLGQGGVVAGSFGQQAMATQYSSSVVNTQNFNLYVTSVAPVSTLVQDFHTMQSLAAV